MKVTIGGDRVGSGKKMKANIHNYYRSTHDLSTDFTSTAAAGPLYPALVLPALRGDTIELNLAADCRTIPTKGPLFGTYKLQVDVFQCPVRLYQGILHNNPLKIGLNMRNVMLPQITITHNFSQYESKKTIGKFANNCLMKYLGVSGIGRPMTLADEYMTREFMAVPVLAYYDIFKNYYANKQEEKAYVLTGNYIDGGEITIFDYESYAMLNNTATAQIYPNEWFYLPYQTEPDYDMLIHIQFKKIINNLSQNAIPSINDIWKCRVHVTLTNSNETEVLEKTMSMEDFLGKLNVEDDWDGNSGILELSIEQQESQREAFKWDGWRIVKMKIDSYETKAQSELKIQPFDLTNIDDMRYDILSAHTLGSAFHITSSSKLPYKVLCDTQSDNQTLNKVANNGLVLKTYQNDIFNNWLNTDWIEGENGINELSKVGIENGAFTMDALNFAQKLYNMLNRVAVAGATYEDWQDVVYEERAKHAIESPVFLGGMSKEIVFDEVVQSAPADGDPLGTLGGRGRTAAQSQKGGHIIAKVDEASFIIAIASITPRLNYSQGNEFYMTELKSMDDFHKPAFDGIGFQDLIGERLAYWDTELDSEGEITQRSKIGKLPAWIEYMTNVNRTFGDFADVKESGYMVLNRNYEYDNVTGGIKDATTYIDPTKYNYAFAYTQLDAQNFWLQIKFNIKARRLMSARLIPNV